jgi:DNA sulfur modification protein DndD
MIITQLTITNFGVYQGHHEFNLRPHRVEDELLPIVLFGGKNGAGKTTILEAIRLCLYGRSALGTRVRRTDYDSYILQRFHRGNSTALSARSARVGLIFEHTHAGVLSTYDAVRSWRIEGQTVNESLSIYKDGQILRDISPDHWNDFLRDLIPPGVANLFFFDGEQIQMLADEETESEALETAIRGLLNLGLISRLQSDLSIYIKQQEQRERSELLEVAEKAQTAFQSLEQVRQERKQDKAGLKTQLDRVSAQLSEARLVLVREGAGFVEQRTALEARQTEVERSIEETRNAIRDLAANLLPFAIAPKWSQRLKERLTSELRIEQERASREAKKEQATEIALRLLDSSFQQKAAPSVGPQDWANIAAEIQSILLPQEPDHNFPILHYVSSQQRAQLQDWIRQALQNVPFQIQTLGQKLEALESEYSQLQQALRQIPDDAVANPLLEQFYSFSEARGRLIEQIERVTEELNQIEFQLADLDRQRKKAWQQLASAADNDKRVERAAQAQVILDEYLERITLMKIQELESRVAHYFNLLSRKQMLVREVSIDPKKYVVTLYSENRVVIPKSSLSAGERQLYAMALLWALRSVSGRMLPIIVDTPMGRLDSDHRSTLLKQFFPNAAHQIILLSTDTEIDAQAYELLKPAISHAFLLDFDTEAGYTRVERRYFVEETEEVIQ